MSCNLIDLFMDVSPLLSVRRPPASLAPERWLGWARTEPSQHSWCPGRENVGRGPEMCSEQKKNKTCIDPTKDIQECIQSTAFSATLSRVSRSNDRNPATLVQVRRNSLGTPASCWGNELDFMPSIYVSAENSFASYWYCIALPKTQGYSQEH